MGLKFIKWVPKSILKNMQSQLPRGRIILHTFKYFLKGFQSHTDFREAHYGNIINIIIMIQTLYFKINI